MGLLIKNININDIAENKNNAKLHPDWQVEQIAKSIQEFGFNDPIAVNSNNRIIEGHGRFLALKSLGYKEVSCIVLDDLTEEQERAYIIAHNKLTLNTEFDLDKLEYELNALKIEEIDLSSMGFTETELEELFSKEKETKKEKDLSDSIEERFELTIKFDNEQELEKAYYKLKGEGYECEISTL